MRSFFESTWSLKIASVIIAIALWFFVNSRGVSEITIAVPIEIKNMPGGYEIVKQKTNEVDVGLRGHERLIKGLKIQDIRVYVDMAKADEGWNTNYINKENIKVPPSMEVTKIDPSVVKIKIEKTVKKEITIKSVVRGTPAGGYRVKSVKVEPEVVIAEGAKSVMAKAHQLTAEAVDISDKKATVRQTADIMTNGQNIRLSEDEVTVIVEIEEGKK